jgi:hypothetical protein
LHSICNFVAKNKSGIVLKHAFYLILVFIGLFASAQEFVPNGSFEELEPCIEGSSRPSAWIFTDHSRTVRIRSGNGQPCTEPSILAAPDGNHFLSFGFSVNTSTVQPLFIQTKLNQPLQKGSVYEISFMVRKDALSIGSIREIQLVFGSGVVLPNMNIHLRPQQQNVLTVPLMDVSSQQWQQFRFVYRAKGTEHYLAFGSLHQRFQLRQGIMNYAAERQDDRRENAVYFIDKLSIQPTNDNADWTDERSRKNLINDLPYSTPNLIENGSFENFNQQQRYSSDNILPGAEIARGWYNLTNYGSSVLSYDNIRDFRDSRYVPFTGKAVAVIDFLRTNEHHRYGQSWRTIRNDSYNTVHRFENMPNDVEPQKFKRGAYLTNALTAPLEKDSIYLFSTMIRLANTSSFGIQELGIYFLKEFPKNNELQLFDREPDLIVNLNPENSNSWNEWEEILGFYTAKGGENYVAIGYFNSQQNGIFSNQNFQREEFSRCGPRGAYDCWDEVVTYKDSLFARYMVDNVVLRKYDLKNALGAEIFDKNQYYHYYLAFDLGGDKTSNYILDELKPILYQAFHGLPYHHSMDLVLLHRNYQRIPFGGGVNQNQIQRNINRLRIRRRAGSTQINESLFRAALENHPEETKQKYILVTDGQLPVLQLQNLLSVYSSRVDFLILFIGPPTRFSTFKANIEPYGKNEIIFFRDREHEQELFLKIWR